MTPAEFSQDALDRLAPPRPGRLYAGTTRTRLAGWTRNGIVGSPSTSGPGRAGIVLFDAVQPAVDWALRLIGHDCGADWTTDEVLQRAGRGALDEIAVVGVEVPIDRRPDLARDEVQGRWRFDGNVSRLWIRFPDGIEPRDRYKLLPTASLFLVGLDGRYPGMANDMDGPLRNIDLARKYNLSTERVRQLRFELDALRRQEAREEASRTGRYAYALTYQSDLPSIYRKGLVPQADTTAAWDAEPGIYFVARLGVEGGAPADAETTAWLRFPWPSDVKKPTEADAMSEFRTEIPVHPSLLEVYTFAADPQTFPSADVEDNGAWRSLTRDWTFQR